MLKKVSRVWFFCIIAVLPLWCVGVTINILHTNDIHQHLEPLPRIAALAAEYRQQHPNTVFVDAGDYFDRGSSLVPITRGEAVYGAMHHMGYDMLILGNHDWAYGGARMFELMDKYPVTVLGTNLETTRPAFPAALKKSIIKEFDGIRVGFIGITLDAYGKNPKGRPYLYVLDCRKETARAVAELKNAGVDIIVAVTHLGLGKMKHESKNKHPSDVDLAREFPDIDIIVGGHSHTDMKEVQTREIYEETGVVIVQTGGVSRFLGRLSFDVDSDSHKIKSFDVEHIASTEATGEHAATAKFLKGLYSRYMPNAKQPAGKIDKRIELYNMGYWYSDFINNKSGSEIVLMPRDTLYDEHSSFKAKSLTMEDLFAMLYNRYLIKSTVTGEELLKYCDAEKMRHRFNPFHHQGRPFSGNAFYYSGFDITYDSATQDVNFSIDSKKTYTLVTPWPYSGSDIRRHRHVLPERSVVDLKNPVPGLKVQSAEFIESTTWQLLSAEVNQSPLSFPHKYSEPPACWTPWTALFESKMKK